MPKIRKASKPWRCNECGAWIGYADYYMHDNYRHVCMSCAMQDEASKSNLSTEGVVLCTE
jgi:hypothetical protein